MHIRCISGSEKGSEAAGNLGEALKWFWEAESRVGGKGQEEVGTGERSGERKRHEEQGGASLSFIRPLIFLLHLQLHLHSLDFSRTFPHQPTPLQNYRIE